MGGFFTSILSPALIMWLGLTFVPSMLTRPFLMASAATERVLKIREAQSHLSILAEGFAMPGRRPEGCVLPSLKLFAAITILFLEVRRVVTAPREASFLSELVELVHGVVNTTEHEALDNLNSRVNGRLKCEHVLTAVVTKHPFNLSAPGKVVTYAHA